MFPGKFTGLGAGDAALMELQNELWRARLPREAKEMT